MSGRSVSINDNGLRVSIGATHNGYGSPINNNPSGRLKVYDYNGTFDQVVQDIDGEVGTLNNGWSNSISSDGSIVLIGNPGAFPGHACVFRSSNVACPKPQHHYTAKRHYRRHHHT